MKKIMSRIKSLLIICSLFFVSVNPVCVFAHTQINVYYVSKDGSDSNPGTLSAPFATINYAAENMNPGDICYIREGVYYETLDTNMNGTADRRISFCAYNGERVTISGGELLTNWSKHSGNIYVADMNWDIYYGTGNMIFANNDLCFEARWPNANVEDLLDRNTYAKVDSANALTVLDDDLPDFDLTGAQMWIANGPSYWSTLVNINEHNISQKTLTVDNVFSSNTYYPAADNIYYITRDYDLLDSPGEWYKDIKNGKIYFFAPDNTDANDMKIEAKKREYAINLTNSSYVSFYGINVRNGLVSFAENTHDCRLSNAVIESLDYRMRTGVQPSAKGVVIGGHNNRLSGCEIKNMFGEGVTLQGNNNYVTNNYIHDINFEHTYSDGVYITGSSHLVSRNTITATGRSTIGGKFEGCVISYNDLSDSCRISKDGGTLYFNAYNYKNSEIHHNIIHDAMNNDGLQYGLYLDSFTTSMVIYNNLVYGMEPNDSSGTQRLTLCVNPNSLNNLFINNTFVNTRPANTHGGSTYDLSGCVFINNLFRSQAHALSVDTLASMNVVFKNNLQGSIDDFADYWNNSENKDYTLAFDSVAIDTGIVISGITDEFIGSAPDCGAFEYGKAPWTVGHDFSVDYEPEFKLNDKIPYRNLITNPGFENQLENWNGDTEIFESDSWSMWGKFTKDGSKSVKMSGGDTLSCKVSGLKPYTCYEFGGYGFVGGTFVGANEYSQAYDLNHNACQRLSDSLPLSNIGAVGALEYNVDFGDNEYDKLVFGVRYHKKGQKITFRKGSLTSEPIAEINETTNYSYVGWKWYELDLNKTLSGNNTLFVCFEKGDFSSTSIGGFYPCSSVADDNIVINAISDSDNEKKITLNSKVFDKPMSEAYIITGTRGEITINIEKNGNSMYGYVDYITVCEKPEEIINEDEDVLVAGVSVKDINGNFYGNDNFASDNFNIFEISLVNTTDEVIPIKAMLVLYDDSGSLREISSIESNIIPKEKTNLILGKNLGTDIKVAKLLVWETLESLKPVTYASEFYKNVTGD